MPFGHIVSLHMVHLIRTPMKFTCNAPRPSKSIHNFGNEAVFLIRLDQLSNKVDVADGE